MTLDSTNSNSSADTNALTKSDSENDFPINFQPMPKKHMVNRYLNFMKKKLKSSVTSSQTQSYWRKK